ncbi:hypothetical protein CPB84DRAFT_1735843 [Gymnopilus junonius]|uniref:BTB domain-containing protein n=1 Tax=Gymnopilus junonius TaxID=109634 RepID=A0A9P5NEF4_GYMJU|nr:hypothetical protein CPB84DRAFT_1735843 [Gymnopilus junonius]
MTDGAMTINILLGDFSVSAQDADITVKSSDGFLFNLHSHNLGTNTGAFPGPEIGAQGEAVLLTEPANVLEIVFQFIYPRRHPKLDDLDFVILMEVTEACEKYEVYSAMNMCEVRLNAFISEHAAEIFVHAVKHGYPELIDKTAILVCRFPVLNFVKTLPSYAVIPWLEYQQAWRKIFDDAKIYLEDLLCGSYCHQYDACADPDAQVYSDGRPICSQCRLSLLVWLQNLAEIEDITSLKDAVAAPNLVIYSYGPLGRWCKNCSNTCAIYLPEVKSILETRMTEIIPFTRFLYPTDRAPSAR